MRRTVSVSAHPVVSIVVLYINAVSGRTWNSFTSDRQVLVFLATPRMIRSHSLHITWYFSVSWRSSVTGVANTSNPSRAVSISRAIDVVDVHTVSLLWSLPGRLDVIIYDMGGQADMHVCTLRLLIFFPPGSDTFESHSGYYSFQYLCCLCWLMYNVLILLLWVPLNTCELYLMIKHSLRSYNRNDEAKRIATQISSVVKTSPKGIVTCVMMIYSPYEWILANDEVHTVHIIFCLIYVKKLKNFNKFM